VPTCTPKRAVRSAASEVACWNFEPLTTTIAWGLLK
jgi:hypothetical protein